MAYAAVTVVQTKPKHPEKLVVATQAKEAASASAHQLANEKAGEDDEQQRGAAQGKLRG